MKKHWMTVATILTLLPTTTASWAQTPAEGLTPESRQRVAQAELLRVKFNSSADDLKLVLDRLARQARTNTRRKIELQRMARCVRDMKVQARLAWDRYAQQVSSPSFQGSIPSDPRSVVESQLHCQAQAEGRQPGIRGQVFALIFRVDAQGIDAGAVNEVLAQRELYTQPFPTEVTSEPITVAPTPVLQQGPDFGTTAWIQANYPGDRPTRDRAAIIPEQAQQLFPNFDIQYQNGRASLRGRVYIACRAAFTLENSSQTTSGRALTGLSDSGENIVGFRISDNSGAGRRCMQALSQDGQTQCEADEFMSDGKQNPRFCVSLSSIEGGSNANFGLVPAGRIGIIAARNPNSEVDAPQGFAVGDIRHRPAAEIAAEQEEESRRVRLGEIEVLMGIARDCRDTGSDRDAAMDAVSRLQGYDSTEVADVFPQFSPDDLIAQIARSQLHAYPDRIADADLSELAIIREELRQMMLDHPEQALDIRKLYEKIANRYVEIGHENPDESQEAFAEARASMGELIESGLYSRNEITRFREVSNELNSLELEAAASEGYYSQRFWSMWNEQYRNNYRAIMTSCYGARVGHFGMTAMFSSRSFQSNRNMDTCSGATNRFQRTMSASMTAAQTTMEQNRLVAQMNNNFQMQSLQLQNSMMMGLSGNSQQSASFLGGTIGQMNGPSPLQVQSQPQFPSSMPLNTPLQ